MVLGAAEMVLHQTRPVGKQSVASRGSIADVRTIMDSVQQVTSNLRGSAKYSFGPGYGKPRHLKGSAQIEVLDSRHRDYVQPGLIGPAAGSYNTQDAVGRHGPPSHQLAAHRELTEKQGHPLYARAPAFMFGAATEVRDSTRLPQVRSDSQLGGPGPGQYSGLQEKIGQLHKQPAYSMRPKCDSLHHHRSLPGPLEYDTSKQKDFSQRRNPSWKFEKQKRENRAIEESYGPGRAQNRATEYMGTPDDIGPGTYKHATAFNSKF